MGLKANKVPCRRKISGRTGGDLGGTKSKKGKERRKMASKRKPEIGQTPGDKKFERKDKKRKTEMGWEGSRGGVFQRKDEELKKEQKIVQLSAVSRSWGFMERLKGFRRKPRKRKKSRKRSVFSRGRASKNGKLSIG